MNKFLVNRNNYREKFPKINIIYTYLLVLSPILSLYGIGISNITIIDSFLLILNSIFLLMIIKQGKINIYINLLPFFLYIIFLSLVIKIDLDALMRTLRYSLYLINIILFVKKFYIYSLGVKIYRFVSLISTGYLIIQISIYNFGGIYLSGVIRTSNLIVSDLYDYHLILEQAGSKRFMSFFAEPSHYAIYILGYITILLYNKQNLKTFNRKDILELMFLSSGVALSTSILGVAVLITILFIWIFIKIFNNKKSFIQVTFFILAFVILLIFLSKTSAFKYFTNTDIISKQGGGRFRGYKIFKDWDNNIMINVFGRGMVGMVGNNYSPFLASYPLLVYYFGYIGLVLFVLAFIPYLLKTKMNLSKALTVCMLGIAIGSEFIFGIFILLYVPLIMKSNIMEKSQIVK